MLLVAKFQLKPDYFFVPYKFGCYSFQANADLTTMIKYNQVKSENNCWIKTDSEKYFSSLKDDDKQAIRKIKLLYGDKSVDELIKITYLKYPYYAVNSTIAKERLSESEYQLVLNARPISKKTILYTIGYEGVSLEEYLNKLILNDINVLCDVRKNPVSMKYGFSKSQLQKACEGLGIEYIHIPEFGIDSDKRQELNTQLDYNNLFALYRRSTLTETKDKQEALLTLLVERKRVALTCFEANICQCHRKHLADAIVGLPGFNFELRHI